MVSINPRKCLKSVCSTRFTSFVIKATAFLSRSNYVDDAFTQPMVLAHTNLNFLDLKEWELLHWDVPLIRLVKWTKKHLESSSTICGCIVIDFST